MKTIRTLFRWELIAAAVLISLLLAPALRSAPGPGGVQRTVIEAPLRNAYEQQMTSLASAAHPEVPSGAYLAWIEAEAQNLRFKGSAHPGTLSTRTDQDTAVCTLPDSRGLAHGITVAHTVSVWWHGGKRTGMTVSAVSGTALTVDGGSGDNFPVVNTPVEVGADPTATVGSRIFAGERIPYPGDPNRLRLIQEAASGKANLIMWVPVEG